MIINAKHRLADEDQDIDSVGVELTIVIVSW